MKITCNETNYAYPTTISGEIEPNPGAIARQEEEETPFAEAVRLFKASVLTGSRGLTAEEKEKIREAIEAFLEESGFLERYRDGIATESDFAALNDFIKQLAAQFGFPRDFFDFVAEFVNDFLGEHANPETPQHPPFEVKVPPQHELRNEKPRLASFQPISPLQFLVAEK
ncbi:MAG: hypothetical protein FWF79_02370 [Defluviitaleaceae bacterium]|nr:hypothetical protein [Defluviitaleaceae bacterium]